MARSSVGYTWMMDSTGQSVRVLTYKYTVSKEDGIHCRFHLLSEVGEPWQAEMKEMLAVFCREHNAHVETREFIGHPHFAEVLIDNPPAAN